MLPLTAMLAAGGCGMDRGVRGSPFEGLREGLAAVGAFVGVTAGLSALQQAGGEPGNGTEYLFRPEHEW
ncbi:MAG TPA: hypothetical protein VFF69_05565 [Phycisphaerales bacterium]|nr:hypothetical protein [Phycisphaerales bacterium]